MTVKQEIEGAQVTAATVTTKKQLEVAQLDAILTALAERPGLTAYRLGMFVPVPQPSAAQQRLTGLLAVSAPLTLVLKLLGQLGEAGRVRFEPDPNGARWYLQPETPSTTVEEPR